MEKTYTFTNHEELTLFDAIVTALLFEQDNYNHAVRENNKILAKIELGEINELKALLRRFSPNVPDSELFKFLYLNYEGGDE